MGERAADSRFHLFRRRLPPPLPQVLAVRVEHHHAPVAITVGEVHVPVLRVARDARRLVEAILAGIEELAALGTVVGIEHALRADLREKLPVVGVFLHHAVAVGADPHVVVPVDGATVRRRGQHVPVTPRPDELPIQVEDHHCRRADAGLLLLLGDVSPVHDEHVIVMVHVDARELPADPAIGQGLGPGRIDLETRRCGLGRNRAHGGGGRSGGRSIHIVSLWTMDGTRGLRERDNLS